jgi:glycosyltransferase involved in cell wall biosynthesis
MDDAMEPARILQLITELAPGGAERIVYELARGLPRERYAVQVCSLRPATGAVAGWLRREGIPVHSLEMARKLDAGAPRRLAQLLERERIQVLHTHLFHANLIGRLATRSRRDLIVLGTIHIAEKRFRPWHFWLDRVTLGPRGVEVCVSEAVRAFTREQAGIPEAQLRVIANGVDLARFAPYAEPSAREQAGAELRRAQGLAPGTRVAVAVGRLEPQKGYPDLLSAWARLGRDARPAVSGAALLIAGEGRERARLERQIADFGLAAHVRLLGHCEDVPRLLAGADALAFSSHYEGFGLALVEALAAGLPVVATSVDSVPEVLGECAAARQVPARDPAALAAALGEVLAAPDAKRARWAETARVRAQAFALPQMLSAYAALYQELLTVSQ